MSLQALCMDARMHECNKVDAIKALLLKDGKDIYRTIVCY